MDKKIKKIILVIFLVSLLAFTVYGQIKGITVGDSKGVTTDKPGPGMSPLPPEPKKPEPKLAEKPKPPEKPLEKPTEPAVGFEKPEDFTPKNIIGMVLWVLGNDQLIFVLTSLLIFIILYAIYLSALRFVKPFQEGGKITKQGTIVALGFALLSTTGIIIPLVRQKGIIGATKTMLAPFGFFSGLVLAVVVFMIIYFGLGAAGEAKWKAGMGAGGITMVLAGWLLQRPSLFSTGWLLSIIALVFAFFGLMSEEKAKERGPEAPTSEEPGPEQETPSEGPPERRRGPGPLTPEDKRAISGIHRSLSHLNHAIRSQLDKLQAEANKLNVDYGLIWDDNRKLIEEEKIESPMGQIFAMLREVIEELNNLKTYLPEYEDKIRSFIREIGAFKQFLDGQLDYIEKGVEPIFERKSREDELTENEHAIVGRQTIQGREVTTGAHWKRILVDFITNFRSTYIRGIVPALDAKLRSIR